MSQPAPEPPRRDATTGSSDGTPSTTPRLSGRTPRARSSPARRLLIAFVVLGSLAAAAWWAWPRLLRYLVLEHARRRGVALELGSVRAGFGWVRLGHFGFRLLGVPGLHATAQQLTVRLDGRQPTAIEASGVTLEVQGSASDLALVLSNWLRRYPPLVGVPASAEGVTLRWRTTATATPWLEIEGASVQPAARGARLQAEHTRVLGLDVGRVALAWRGEQAEARLGLGRRDLEQAPLSLVVERGPPAHATLRLASLRLQELAAPLGVALPLPGVRVEGQLGLRFDGGLEAGPTGGTLHARFDGYAPPVPPELGQVVFGTTTTVDTTLAISPDRRRVILDPMKVVHGALELQGKGHIERATDHARIGVRLAGELSCSALADAVARSRLGATLGGLLGTVARQAVGGTVRLGLEIDADSRRLAQATVRPRVGVGCGLRPPPLLHELLPKLPLDGQQQPAR